MAIMPHDIAIRIKDLHHWFGRHKVLYKVDFEIVRGEIVSLVGPSGCGKSTLLRAITGTHLPELGQVTVYPADSGTNGKPVKGPGRDRGIVYQRYSLFPFLTALQNVAIGPMLDQTSLAFRFFNLPGWRMLRKQHLEESAALLERVGLEHAIGRYPHELSGGMCQRVALAQALIMKPEILLLDEPFGALDEATREDLQVMLLTLYAENVEAKRRGEKPPYTIMIVTHELNEALYVGDRLIGLTQFWDWRGEGHETAPGATITYDKVAPVYRPNDPKDTGDFLEQREEIRKVVFEESYHQPRNEYRVFWDQVDAGQAGGVLAP
jgi:NitT/TauT family transport system ATP-binding protein